MTRRVEGVETAIEESGESAIFPGGTAYEAVCDMVGDALTVLRAHARVAAESQRENPLKYGGRNLRFAATTFTAGMQFLTLMGKLEMSRRRLDLQEEKIRRERGLTGVEDPLDLLKQFSQVGAEVGAARIAEYEQELQP